MKSRSRSEGAILTDPNASQTVTSMKTFVLAMVLHPEVYKKAQAEMDRVVGPGRLPDFEDREHLPYLDCVLKEVFRYVHVALPHEYTLTCAFLLDRWNAPVPLG